MTMNSMKEQEVNNIKAQQLDDEQLEMINGGGFIFDMAHKISMKITDKICEKAKDAADAIESLFMHIINKK